MRTMAFGLVVRLCRDSRGAFPIKFIIAFLSLLLVAAVAMVLSRVLAVEQKLTKAFDADALAVGRQLGRDDADITALAEGSINANGTAAKLGDLTSPAVASTVTQVDITATTRVGTVFLPSSRHHLSTAYIALGRNQLRLAN